MYRAMIMIVNVDEASKGSVRSGQGVIVAVLGDSGALEVVIRVYKREAKDSPSTGFYERRVVMIMRVAVSNAALAPRCPCTGWCVIVITSHRDAFQHFTTIIHRHHQHEHQRQSAKESYLSRLKKPAG